jgi:hypothetical protein
MGTGLRAHLDRRGISGGGEGVGLRRRGVRVSGIARGLGGAAGAKTTRWCWCGAGFVWLLAVSLLALAVGTRESGESPVGSTD